VSVISLPVPLDAMPLPDLELELLGLAGHIAAAECRFLQLLAEFDQRNGWAGDGIRSCAHWLSWRAGMSLRTATEHLRVAHALRNLPRITEAFAAGLVSYSKVRAITRIAGSDAATLTRLAAEITAGDSDLRHTTVADPATAEQVLLNVALHGTASHVETVVQAVRRRHTPPAHHAARRSLSWRWDDDGSLILRARLTPDQGATLIAAIEALIPPGSPVTPRPRPRPRTWTSALGNRNPGRRWIGSRPAGRTPCSP
jgi:hypothetical protein